jgi:hypothetical protein
MTTNTGMTTYMVVAKDGRTTLITTYTYSDAFQQATDFCGGALLESMTEV